MDRHHRDCVEEEGFTVNHRIANMSSSTCVGSSDSMSKLASQQSEKRDSTTSAGLPIQLDPQGLPLVPQPSRFTDDPLNWPSWLKWAVLIQVGFMAFLGPYNAALINPSLVLLSKGIGVDSKTAAYSTTTGIILGGVSPFLWAPLANYYGRRPVTLCALVLTICGGIGSGVSPDFSALLGTRALCGFGFGGMMSIGTACVNDMFFFHERGAKTGVYSIFVTNGAHVAALIGGFLGQAEGWRWDYWLGAISTALSFVVALFLFPETLFSRDSDFLSSRTRTRTYFQLLFDFKGNMIPGRRLRASDFLQTFKMLKYPSIVLPFCYYAAGWTFVNVLPALTLATIYTHFFNLKSGPIGACLGISLMIGSILGEFFAGKASDLLMTHLAKRHNGQRQPEHRLYLCTLSALFMPAGLVVFGATVSSQHDYKIPLVGLGIGVFGLQIASTTLYAYVSDAYKPQTAESGVLFNLGRGLSFTVGFVALPFAAAVGYFWAWFTFAGVLLTFFFPIVALMIWGAKWRMQLGEPEFHNYL